MKVIDLLNKIANGEELPKKIKYCNKIYIKRSDCYWYTLEKGTFDDDLFVKINRLNDEVEIIEEEFEDIEQETEIQLLKVYQEYLENNFTVTMTNIISDIEAIFNETNDKINQLIKNQKLIIEKIGENK